MANTGTVLAFGTFDGLHPGHEFFLREARQLGERLVVVVARDAAVKALKNRPPRRPLVERLQAVRELDFVTEAVAGDDQTGDWQVLQRFKPDVIALGHDQLALEQALRGLKLNCRLVRLGRLDYKKQ